MDEDQAMQGAGQVNAQSRTSRRGVFLWCGAMRYMRTLAGDCSCRRFCHWSSWQVKPACMHGREKVIKQSSRFD